MIEIRPFLLYNTIQHYEWGTRNAEAFIPRFLGIPAEPDRPYAELWIGAHPKSPSDVQKNNERIPLDDFIRQAPREILGAQASERFSSKLPFLLKLLSAGAPLSIQAHPNKHEAAGLHARDPKNYPDDNHKPEIAVALDELTALAGFKPYDDILRTLHLCAPLAECAGIEVSRRLAEAPNEVAARRAALKPWFHALMTRATRDPDLCERTVDRIGQMFTAMPSVIAPDVVQLFSDARRLYGADVGLLSMLVMNHVRLKKGEGLFLGPGIPHAYIRGTIVECMANSDNVVRAGLTPKFKDIETLCAILTYECGAPLILRPDANERLTEYPAPVDEFTLTRLLMHESDTISRTDNRTLSIMLVVEGSVSIATEKTGRQLFQHGDVVLIPAAVARYDVAAHTEAELFFAAIP